MLLFFLESLRDIHHLTLMTANVTVTRIEGQGLSEDYDRPREAEELWEGRSDGYVSERDINVVLDERNQPTRQTTLVVPQAVGLVLETGDLVTFTRRSTGLEQTRTVASIRLNDLMSTARVWMTDDD